ncbi:porin family protein [Flexithrix dorotheae]|uniref:porin family protein n=1 Tax=Flexithrix dorotheae TaxID=70993 RepID=UPI0003628DF5|nr:porin family protein [Flexithrix dorotheae]
MKKLFFALLVLVTIQTANAQLLKFGLRAGLSSSSVKANDLLISSQDELNEFLLKTGDSKVGYHVGLMSQINIPILPFAIMPELLLTNTGGEYQVKDVASGEIRKADVSFARLDFPILLAFKLGPLRLNAGPIGSIILSEDNGLEDIGADVSQSFNGATWGYQAGLGVDLAKKVALDLKYEGNLSDLGDKITVGGKDYNFDTRTNQLILSLGYYF